VVWTVEHLSSQFPVQASCITNKVHNHILMYIVRNEVPRHITSLTLTNLRDEKHINHASQTNRATHKILLVTTESCTYLCFPWSVVDSPFLLNDVKGSILPLKMLH
jgi:hypothetical protein